MNAKTCKKIRNFLRRRHIDPREVLYVRNRAGAISLYPSCGRAQYQSAKKPF